MPKPAMGSLSSGLLVICQALWALLKSVQVKQDEGCVNTQMLVAGPVTGCQPPKSPPRGERSEPLPTAGLTQNGRKGKHHSRVEVPPDQNTQG
jgi:hypothetical protein